MRNECRVCKTDNTMEEIARELGIFIPYTAFQAWECKNCHAVAIYRDATHEVRWYRFDSIVAGFESAPEFEEEPNDSDSNAPG